MAMSIQRHCAARLVRRAAGLPVSISRRGLVQRRFHSTLPSPPTVGPSSSSTMDDNRRADLPTSSADEDMCDLEGLLTKRTPEELQRTRRTTEFVNAVCTTPHNQLAVDMICAAMKLGTLKEAHLSAMLRRLKVLDATASASGGGISPETSSPSVSPVKPRSLPDPPMRRMFSILTTVLLEGYASAQRPRQDTEAEMTASDGAKVSDAAVGGAPRVSSAIFNHALLWFLHPFVQKVKAAEALDNVTDCSTSSDDDIEDEDEEDIDETRRIVVGTSSSLSSPSGSRVPVDDIWRYVALLELHGIPVVTEIALDALALLLRAEAASYRSTHSGENSPVEMEFSQHRLEFLDRQRNALRERLEHRRIVAAASSGATNRTFLKRPAQPHRETITVPES